MESNDNSGLYTFDTQGSASDMVYTPASPAYIPGEQYWSGEQNWPQFAVPQAQPVFRPSRFGMAPKKPPSQPQVFYCDICRISCAGPRPYADHLAGQKHKKKEAVIAAQQKIDSNAQTTKKPASASAHHLYCEICDVTCASTDTFAAHLSGTKHERVVNLHKSLGKPVPEIVVPKTSLPAPRQTPAPASVVPATGTSPEAESLAPGSGHAAVPSLDVAKAADATNSAADGKELIGAEFIEELRNDKGVIVSYSCRLCECSFTDPNARRVHLRGKRHHLQYKKKIDSSLKVEVKPNARKQKLDEERAMKRQAKESYWKEQDLLLGMRLEQNWDFGGGRQWGRQSHGMAIRRSTVDDRLMLDKHMALYPPKNDMAEIHKAIMSFEKALKLVSDKIAAEGSSKVANKDGATETKGAATETKDVAMETKDVAMETTGEVAETKDEAEVERRRVVKGAMRVGFLSKGLLLCDEVIEHLVVVCSEKPTRSLLQAIVDQLPEQLAIVSPKKFAIETRYEEAGLLVTIDEPLASFAVTLTSVAYGDDVTAETESVSPDPVDLLSKEYCVSALAHMRHTKWFQARLSTLKAGTVVAHVLRDFCRRNPVWKSLGEWACQLLVEKCIFAAGIDVGPGEALRSIFECLSSGILLAGGQGLLDPCEKHQMDATANLTKQQREDITAGAQRWLRLIVFHQMHKVLDVEPFKPKSFKRKPDQMEATESVQSEEKKPRKEDEDGDDFLIDLGEDSLVPEVATA